MELIYVMGRHVESASPKTRDEGGGSDQEAGCGWNRASMSTLCEYQQAHGALSAYRGYEEGSGNGIIETARKLAAIVWTPLGMGV
jgi:hypothetical protein